MQAAVSPHFDVARMLAFVCINMVLGKAAELELLLAEVEAELVNLL